MWDPLVIHKREWEKINCDELISGRIPAIIFKEFYDENFCKQVVKKISKNYFKNFQNGKLTHLGPFLMNYCTKKNSYFKEARQSYTIFENIFEESKMPSNEILDTFRLIYPDSSISLARESGNNFSPFVIRIHEEGKSIPIHKDFVGYEGKDYQISNLDQQLSCILHLQEPESGGNLIIYKKKWHKKDEKYRNIDFGYSEKLVSSGTSSVISNIDPGDLVMINPIHYHKVTTIFGSIPRITLGMFVGFFRSQNQIVSWA